MMESREEQAEKAVRYHMVWSMGAGLIPFPLADIFTVGAVQLNMIRQLCGIYGVEFKEEEGKAVITSLTSSTLAKIGARTAIKLIPGIGSIIGGVTMSVLSGASSYAVGQTFRAHFEKGGTILDIDLGKLKKVYQDKFEKGKEVAKDYQKNHSDATAEPSTPVPTRTEPQDEIDRQVQKLKDLGELLKEGIITRDEFDLMKKKILNDT